MKKLAIVLGSVMLGVALVAVGLFASSVLAQGRGPASLADYGPMGRMMGLGPAGSAGVGFDSLQDIPCGEGWQEGGMPFGPAEDMPCGEGWQGTGTGGYGMMGGNWDRDDMPFDSAQGMPCGGAYATPSGEGEVTSLEQAETAVLDYVERLGYTGLEVTEVMEFEHNFYAIVAEADTGIGAMEVLVDKASGAVGPEPGPNMMWNTKYGMHGSYGGMMGMRRAWGWEGTGDDTSGEMALTPEDAQGVAQRWLDENLPGRSAGEADQFYGYYTLHFLRAPSGAEGNDGQIEGMLSVHGGSGDVWYHSWHGDFISMTEDHE